MIQFVGDCFEKYGKTFRMWILNESLVFTKDIQVIGAIYNSKTLLQKGDLYEFVRAFLQDGLLLSVGKKWHDRRKLFTHAFHFNTLEAYIKVFDKQSTTMAQQLVPLADGRTVIDLFPRVCLAALDVIVGMQCKFISLANNFHFSAPFYNFLNISCDMWHFQFCIRITTLKRFLHFDCHCYFIFYDFFIVQF